LLLLTVTSVPNPFTLSHTFQLRYLHVVKFYWITTRVMPFPTIGCRFTPSRCMKNGGVADSNTVTNEHTTLVGTEGSSALPPPTCSYMNDTDLYCNAGKWPTKMKWCNDNVQIKINFTPPLQGAALCCQLCIGTSVLNTTHPGTVTCCVGGIGSLLLREYLSDSTPCWLPVNPTCV